MVNPLGESRLDRAIRRAEGDLHRGGVEAEMDDPLLRDRGISRMVRAETLLSALRPLAAALADDPEAAAGLEVLADMATGRHEREHAQIAALDAIRDRDPEVVEVGVPALMRSIRGGR